MSEKHFDGAAYLSPEQCFCWIRHRADASGKMAIEENPREALRAALLEGLIVATGVEATPRGRVKGRRNIDYFSYWADAQFSSLRDGDTVDAEPRFTKVLLPAARVYELWPAKQGRPPASKAEACVAALAAVFPLGVPEKVSAEGKRKVRVHLGKNHPTLANVDDRTIARAAQKVRSDRS